MNPSLLGHIGLTARMYRSIELLHLFVQFSLPLLVLLKQVSCNCAENVGA